MCAWRGRVRMQVFKLCAGDCAAVKIVSGDSTLVGRPTLSTTAWPTIHN